MSRKRLVLMVEGDGDAQAAPVLLKRLLADCNAFDVVTLDPDPLRVGEYGKISSDDFANWRRFLQVAAKRRQLGECLLILDADSLTNVRGQPFCAMQAAYLLADQARTVGGGSLFSVAIVFACMEFESWLIAGAPTLAGKAFTDGRRELPEKIEEVPPDPESAPRDAKDWFRRIMTTRYKPTRDQAELTRLVDLDAIRQRAPRSFVRLEHAVRELVEAVRRDDHRVSPSRNLAT